MYCPTHKTKMTQLLTSWVCDICQPPGNPEPAPRVPFIDLVKKFLDVPAGTLVPASSTVGQKQCPQYHTCGNGYRWNLWTRDPTELHVPKFPDGRLHYLSSSQVTSVNHNILLRHCCVVVKLTLAPTHTSWSLLKHRYSSLLLFDGLSMAQRGDLTVDLYKSKLNLGVPNEYYIYFLDVKVGP